MSRAGAILAVRSVAEYLAQPAPEFLDAIAAVKGCGLLTQNLPLANASPFGGLPDAAEELTASFPSTARAAGMDLPRPVIAASAQPGQSAQQKPGGREQPPVFSFRRGSTTPAQPAPPRAVTGGKKAIESVERASSATEPPGIVRQEGSQPSSPVALLSIAPSQIALAAGSRPANGSEQAIELLDALATELLAAPVAEPPVLRAGAPPDAKPSARQVAPAFDQVRGETSSTVLSEVTAPPPAEAGVVSHLRIDHRSLTAAAQNERSRAGSASEPAGLRPAAVGNIVPNPPVLETSAFSRLDAETLASMVNEVLAEQARRHGVDLS